jgi:hypothetical protein
VVGLNGGAGGLAGTAACQRGSAFDLEIRRSAAEGWRSDLQIRKSVEKGWRSDLSDQKVSPARLKI